MGSLRQGILSFQLQLISRAVSKEKSALIGKTFKPAIYQQSCYSTDFKQKPYKEKLLTKAREKGFETVEELLEKSKEDLLRKKREFCKIDPLKELENYEQRMKMSENNAGLTKSKGPIDPNMSATPFKTFDSFLKLDKVKDLSKQEIEFLWRAKWVNKDNSLCAVVPLDVFNKMVTKVRENPVFVLPLPRVITGGNEAEGANKEQGVELHYVQWQFVGPNTTHCIITSLAEYKLHNEYSKPHTIFQFHSDLAKEKKCIFMNGQVEPDTNVSLQDAQLLLLNVQRFYGAMGEITPAARQRVQLLQDFTGGSSDFSVDKLISLSQSMEN
ncbi:hypothetical protein HG535_0F02000 [Zygotorulaspora mrakii]|uniref:Uncharacterized protein n=1 Tax=Zygotorulaspora mrakii TaxID=42260 RepID=A0A7H9B6X2_ZYGMR|nr:uncharacterized protein HG535_0F02000 [Zygotorulaspora mrakii]QLG73689.1 hypothetical protein HG535_0F02000 [Zygotorulaspora mrakii]